MSLIKPDKGPNFIKYTKKRQIGKVPKFLLVQLEGVKHNILLGEKQDAFQEPY